MAFGRVAQEQLLAAGVAATRLSVPAPALQLGAGWVVLALGLGLLAASL